MAEQTQNALPGNDPETMQQEPAVVQQTPGAVQTTPAAPTEEVTQAPPANAVTLVVAAPAEETPKKGKKSHRHGAKKEEANSEPLADERAPKRSLSTKRGLIRFLFLTVITAGIYTLFFLSGVSEDMNLLASRHDGKRTPNLLLLPFIVVLTLGIGHFVHWHRFAARIREELWRRRIQYEFGPGKFWGWGFFGILLFGVGPLVFFHKMCVALNKLSEDYNMHG